MVGYVRRHHLGMVALFFALGGSAYAAVALPSNSVGTKQIKNHAVTLAKIASSARASLKGAPGAKGDPGIQGPQGPKGDQGSAGIQGVAGPTASASTSTSTGVTGIGSSDVTLISTTITTTFAARIIANASLSVQKTSGNGDNRVPIADRPPSPFTTFSDISQTMYAADPSASNYYTAIPLSAGVTEPAGTYHIQAVCHTGSPWNFFDGDLTAVAAAS
jgi:hypothetical protein